MAKSRGNQVEVYEGADGQWYWRVRSLDNHQITMTGGQGYATPSNARRAVRRGAVTLALAPITTVTPTHRNGDY